VDLVDLAAHLEGYSGADITYICTRASERAFLDAIEQAQARNIDMDDFAAVLTERKPSVTPRQIRRYEEFRDGRR
jgi:SpoVK/Ycf46/Vps4 family AAA+-type ATPase